jgi:mRNA-degrading endonuclease RelE of RelBE toxin-antitoxin system/PHD/YefM family antitoxin component YafN of YafNO toxin-antitoxin module
MENRSSEKRLELWELPPEVKELVAECELTGRRTVFHRGERAVAILVSHDEYLALRETIDIAADAELIARVNAAEESIKRGQMILSEDLGMPRGNDRLRMSESVEKEWQALSGEEQSLVRAALQTIDDDPIIGAPLFDPLRGLWSSRAGHLRIVYRVVAEARFIAILAIVRAA